jgi:hypothetical protein
MGKEAVMQVNTVENALNGMNQARETVEEAAARIASPDSEQGGRDIVEDILDLRFGKHMLEANALVLKNEMEMQDTVINILA